MVLLSGLLPPSLLACSLSAGPISPRSAPAAFPCFSSTPLDARVTFFVSRHANTRKNAHPNQPSGRWAPKPKKIGWDGCCWMMFMGREGEVRRSAPRGAGRGMADAADPPLLAFVGEKKGAKLESERTRSGCGKDETCGRNVFVFCFVIKLTRIHTARRRASRPLGLCPCHGP